MGQTFRVKTETGWADVTIDSYKNDADRDAQIDAKLATPGGYKRVNNDPAAGTDKPLTTGQKMVRGALAPTVGGVIGAGAGMATGAVAGAFFPPAAPALIAGGGYVGNVLGSMAGEAVNQYMPGVREAVGNEGAPDPTQVAIAGVLSAATPLIGPALRGIPGAGAALQRQWFRAFGEKGERLLKDVPTREVAKAEIAAAKQGAAPLLINTQKVADAVGVAERRRFYDTLPAGFRSRISDLIEAVPAKGKTGQPTGAQGPPWRPYGDVADLLTMAGQAAAAKEEAGGLMAWTAKVIYGGLADAMDETVRTAVPHIRDPLVKATARYKRMVGGEILSDLVEKSTSHTDYFGQTVKKLNTPGLVDRVVKNRDILEKYFDPKELDDLTAFLKQRGGVSPGLPPNQAGSSMGWTAAEGGKSGGKIRKEAGPIVGTIQAAVVATSISAFTDQWAYMLATFGREMVGRALASPAGRVALGAALDHPLVTQSATNAAVQGVRQIPAVKQALGATANAVRQVTRGSGVVQEPE